VACCSQANLPIKTSKQKANKKIFLINSNKIWYNRLYDDKISDIFSLFTLIYAIKNNILASCHMATVEGIMRDTLSSNYNLQSSGP